MSDRDADYVLLGNPEINELRTFTSDLKVSERRWTVSAVVMGSDGVEDDVIDSFDQLPLAQQFSRDLVTGARRIVQVWDQAPLGTLPQ